ncbi:hypothetical protein PVL29_017169 [Vitis rotundifolia]|uniref:Uncharacterized protein n=1 Tax=Vitis rotundifolia TaxID=103349 RepID=A0AA39DK45_VITRO|nr:hypothetical protein PVL29_017169 [Vitis rotundifolia]
MNSIEVKQELDFVSGGHNSVETTKNLRHVLRSINTMHLLSYCKLLLKMMLNLSSMTGSLPQDWWYLNPSTTYNNAHEMTTRSDVIFKDDMITRFEGMMKLGEANACLKQMKVPLNAVEHAKRNAETEAALAKESSEISKSEVKWIELMLSLVIEERDQLRNVVNELKKQKNVEAGDETTNKTFLQEFELSLTKKENCIKALENNLCEQKEVNNHLLNKTKLLNEKLAT